MTVDPDSPELVWEQVLRILRERIVDGTYPVRLPGELALAQELGVARQTLRRAIAVLVDEGVVTVVRNKGVYVKK
ncbi:GntR family transcriptional regulator [Actinocatenispora sera]|uniref:GntR family transcriptional regulator n=1 Tax=Actinocatenispora sera TaxID=390989 RepID=UPI0033F814A8